MEEGATRSSDEMVEHHISEQARGSESPLKAKVRQHLARANALIGLCNQKSNEHSDGFHKLQVHIASILLAFGIVTTSITDGNLGLPEKAVVLVGWSALLLSLFFALLNSRLKEVFWRRATESGQNLRFIWEMTERGELTVDAAEDITRFVQPNKRVDSPDWPWVAQTLALGLGIICLLLVNALLLLRA